MELDVAHAVVSRAPRGTCFNAVWCVAALVLLLQGGAASANELDLMLGDDFGEIRFAREARWLGSREGEISGALLATENNHLIVHATYAIPVLAGAAPIEFSIGARMYLASLVAPDDDVMGLGFGASARYRLPFDRLPILNRFPVHLAASFYYSPEITTSGTGVDITDVHLIRAEVELAPDIDGLIGLRTLDVDRDVGDEDIVDERVYIGIRVRF